ncbi:MAG: FAD-binding protein, partial [Promethearchaeota archaeon]
TQEIEKILKLANKLNFSVIPVSSSSTFKHHGDTVPRKKNSIILNLSKMRKILNIDKKNRVLMVEPGVTFNDIIPKLKEKGLRLLMPLYPTETKSILASALEREPITIPRYHWDSSDPLLCTEVVFGTGDLFRTGTAAGSGTIKQKQKKGIAYVNPMGPTQFSPFRVIQGAQGSLGIVSWATLKLELLPSIQRVFHFQSENIQELLEFQHELIRYRLCDEIFILNNLSLASLVENTTQEIDKLANSISKWNLVYIIAGKGKLSDEKLEYLEGDINDILKNLKLEHLKRELVINESKIIECISEATSYPWRMKFKGGYQDIFFISQFDKIQEYVSFIESKDLKDLGIYIQPINQGTAYHCEFDLYYDPNDSTIIPNIKETFLKISRNLMDLGAFFNRPYSPLAKDIYDRHNDQTQVALKKVKKIFDPNNVLNPGVLCYDK